MSTNSTTDIKKQLALAMIQQLEEYSGEFDEESAESLSIACQCLGEAFGVDPEDEQQVKELSIRPVSLEQAFRVGHAKITQAIEEKQQEQTSSNPQDNDPKFQEFLSHLESKNFFNGVEKGSEMWQKRMDMARQGFEKQFGVSSETETTQKKQVNVDNEPLHEDLSLEARMDQADKYKSEGNAALGRREYELAIEEYTKAIRTYSNNAIYYSNRAAAKTMLEMYLEAATDCRKAISVNPQYAKAYSRLGLALFHLKRYQDAIDEAYDPGLLVDPELKSLIEGKADCVAALQASSNSNASPMGGAGAQSPFNNPNLANLMSNPQIAEMAQNVMSNPAAMQNMMNMFGGGAPPPDAEATQTQDDVGIDAGIPPEIGNLLNNPEIMGMAQQAMQNPEMMNMMANLMGGVVHASPQNQDNTHEM